ncbi:MAG TPA: sigma-70 family RNA polymerase sigma factor [Verrucomicrobiae bacterium]|jgi:uncharacterized protein (TIGR03435 family)|nr:sigma-70 family RNA polymerase sigma factor [Verrucomicrobiae bacterium]
MDETDLELLRQYSEDNSDGAFAALVKRHVNLVYSSAYRAVGAAHAAEEIAQAVFIILARKARSLRKGTILSGWLYQTARLTAANYRRTESRRAQREREAQMQSQLGEDESERWPEIAPLLDEAMGGLSEKDRNAMVLRFFEGKSLSEVGQAFGTSEDAAKMRVNRALEKLRRFYLKRGVQLSAGVLAGTVSAHSVQGAPASLATGMTAAAATGSAATLPILTMVKGTLKMMAWTKAKTAMVVGSLMLLGGGATATLALLKWEAYKAYRGTPANAGGEAWRNPGNNFADVERAAPQVRILPTKFPGIPENLKANPSGQKWIGINVPVRAMAWVAYECAPARVQFNGPAPERRFDFITSLNDEPLAALQEELRNTTGYSGHREVQEADVLRLRVENPNARGLNPATLGGQQNWAIEGRYYCDDVPLASTNRSLLGLSSFLERVLGVPIVDQSGLTQYFNIDLRWDARDPNQAGAIKQALLDRLGLALSPGRERLEILVMEKTK